MERQARFVLMGVFLLAFVAAIFTAIYWLHGFGPLGQTKTYTIRFPGGAPGVSVGASVVFNGVRVGEVTRVGFDPNDPTEVLATIAVDAVTPVRVDTQVGVDNQGLLGGAVISLRGGGVGSPAPKGEGGRPPILTADPALVMSLGETAREVLQRVDKVVAEDADPLHATLSNMQAFTDALSRNAGRVDGILQGLERMTGGGPAAKPPTIYDLATPTSFPQLKKIPGRLIVADPSAIVMYDSQHILEQGKDGGFTFLADAQWSDSLVKLVQAKLIEGFENAQVFDVVSRPNEGDNNGDNQISVDIRSFNVASSPKPIADVALGAKLISADGKVVAERTFHRSTPIASLSPSDAVAGLRDAFAGVTSDIIAWAAQSF